jgi:hypothetical protein
MSCRGKGTGMLFGLLRLGRVSHVIPLRLPNKMWLPQECVVLPPSTLILEGLFFLFDKREIPWKTYILLDNIYIPLLTLSSALTRIDSD